MAQALRRVAAIDLGTNSFLCLIADVQDNKVLQVQKDICTVVRLGENVQNSRRFSPQALARAEDCLKQFKASILDSKVETCFAVSTSAARDVSNFQDLVDIGKRFGIPIEVISGEKEAELTYAGAISGLNKRDGVAVIDVGGGSTEIVYSKSGQIVGKSFDVGCVRLTEMFVSKHPVSSSELQAMQDYAGSLLRNFKKDTDVSKLVAVAGTPTTLAAMDLGIEFEAEKIEGYRISKNKLENWIARLSKMSLKDRSNLPGLDEKRADVIVAGALLLSLGLDIVGVKEMEVSTRGLRFGLASLMSQKSWSL